MGYMTDGLTFNILREGNLCRLPQFRDRKGQIVHKAIDGQPPGFDWSLSDWATALAGELGEACDLIKKVHRGDKTLDEARPDLAKELADIQTYLDILAHRAGINLGEATMAKFNEVSLRVGSEVRIDCEGVHYARATT